MKKNKDTFFTRLKNWIVDFLYRYIILHMAYILFCSFFFAVIIMIIEGENSKIMLTHTPNYIDFVFNTMSAITGTGFTSGNTSNLKLGSQIVIFVCLLLGSMPMLSLCPVVIRRFQLQKVFKRHKRVIRFLLYL
jgi:Trk-type K+ transport system membrane component